MGGWMWEVGDSVPEIVIIIKKLILSNCIIEDV